MKKIKIGLLINSMDIDFYTLDLIKHIKESNLYLDPIIIHGYKKKKSFFEKIKWLTKFGILKAIDKFVIIILLRIIRLIESFSVKKKYPNYFKKFNLKNFFNLTEIKVNGIWSKKEIYLEFNEKELEILSKENFDCIIRCGSGILRGKILKLPKFGILSFHHGDNRVNRGGPSGFWEVLRKEPSSGFIIQRLTNKLDGGHILYRGNMMTASNFTTNHAQLLEKSNFFFKKILDKVATTGKIKVDKKSIPYNKNILKINNSIILVAYLFKVLFPIILKNFTRKIIKIDSPYWSVAYKKNLKNNNSFKNFNFFKNSDFTENFSDIKNPKNRFLADPFVFNFKNRNVIFVEDYSFEKKKGRISAIEIKSDECKFLGVVLEENFHLSFPFIFENNNNIYMIPETSKINEIRLYKSTKFPRNWKLEKILMKNVSAADTMLIKKGSTWFMLTNICSSKIGDHQSELHIFYNDNFLSQNWKSINQGNPVIFDSNYARNGGMFFFNKKLFRINQIHGQAHYGKSFGINEVLVLNKNSFIEKRVKNIEANFKKKITGTHHLNLNSKYIVIDYSKKN